LYKRTNLREDKLDAIDHSKRSKGILKYYLTELSLRGKDLKDEEISQGSLM
jgi:hypothetical protein